MSKAHSGSNNSMFGKKHGADTRAKMSAAKRALKIPRELSSIKPMQVLIIQDRGK
jgi:hypothetical protein